MVKKIINCWLTVFNNCLPKSVLKSWSSWYHHISSPCLSSSSPRFFWSSTFRGRPVWRRRTMATPLQLDGGVGNVTCRRFRSCRQSGHIRGNVSSVGVTTRRGRQVKINRIISTRRGQYESWPGWRAPFTPRWRRTAMTSRRSWNLSSCEWRHFFGDVLFCKIIVIFCNFSQKLCRLLLSQKICDIFSAE